MAILEALRGRIKQRELAAADTIAEGARAAAAGKTYDVTAIEAALVETRQTADDFEAAVEVARRRQTWLKQLEQLATATSRAEKIEAAIAAEEAKLVEARRAAIERCDALRSELATHVARRDQGRDAREQLLRPDGVPGTIGTQWRDAVTARDEAEIRCSETRREHREAVQRVKSEQGWIDQLIGEADRELKPTLIGHITARRLTGDRASRVEQHTAALKRWQQRVADLEKQLGADEKTLSKAQAAVDDLSALVVKA